MQIEKKLTRVFAILLLVLILASVAKINFAKGKISEAENRYLAEFPEIITDSGKLNEKLGTQLKQWFEDNLGFRDEFIKLSSNVQYKLLHRSPTEKVEIGRDGWLFYTLDNNLDIAKGEYPNFDEEALADICNLQVRTEQKLREQGIDYVLVLPASKVSVYPEYIMSGDYSVRKTPADILADYIEAHSDIKVVRLKDALLEAKEAGHQVYFKEDTHWNEYGAYVAYQEAIEKFNQWGITPVGCAEASFTPGTHQGEFSAMMGDQELMDPEECLRISISDNKAVLLDSGETYDAVKNAAQNSNITTWFTYKNDYVEAPKALMYGDSLVAHFSDWSMTELFAQNFSEFTFAWDNNIQQSMIDAVHPDVVIYELGERFLNALTEKNLTIALDKLQDYNAKVIEYTLQDGTLSVTVQNTSSASWSRDNCIRMCLWKDGRDSSLRAKLPRDVTVMPGQTCTFYFDDIDDDIISQNTEAVMLQEGICYFGEHCPITQANQAMRVNNAEIISHNAPATVTHDGTYSIDITVHNTGSSVWSESTHHRLCIYQDGLDHGYRIFLPEGVSVAPGEEYTFTLDGFVLPEADSTWLEFQMLQEGIEYFGERERADIEAVG